MPETWRAQRERDDDGNLIFKQQSAEKPMEQTSSSTGERREFLEAYLQYNRAFKAHHVGGTLKYSQDAYRTTVDIGTDVKMVLPNVTWDWRGVPVITGIIATLPILILVIMVRRILLTGIVSVFFQPFL